MTPLAALFCTALATAAALGARRSRHRLAKGRPAGFLGDFLRLPLAGEQQRLGVRGLHRLHPAECRQIGSHGVTFADLLGGFDMLFARYAPILFALAVAGALAGKRVTPAGLGTMRTDNPRSWCC